MLQARTASECRLYIELNPHECGEREFLARSAVARTPHGLVATYEGACPRCGGTRVLEFVLDDHATPPAPAFGGPSPSTLVDPGQFLMFAGSTAGGAPSTLAGLDDAEAAAARDRLATAAAALEEVLKFIPPAQDRVPAAAFTSVEGRAAYEADPAQFERSCLEAILATYRDRLRT